MARFDPRDEESRLRWTIIDALRRYGVDAGRLGHVFAALHQLQPADLRALIAIMSAEGKGTPLTAGQLREHLGVSAGGASLVIDRLEASGHVKRVRDNPTDNRVVHLRYTDQGRATGLAFFGSLGDQTNTVLDQFSISELAVIERFITAIASTTTEQLTYLDRPAEVQLRAPLPGVDTHGGAGQ